MKMMIPIVHNTRKEMLLAPEPEVDTLPLVGTSSRSPAEWSGANPPLAM